MVPGHGKDAAVVTLCEMLTSVVGAVMAGKDLVRAHGVRVRPADHKLAYPARRPRCRHSAEY